MWALVLGAAGLAIALYELYTRPSAAEIAAAAVAGTPLKPLASPLDKPFAVGGPLRYNAERVAACGLKPQDWVDAERWTRDRMGPSLAVQDRLNLIRSMVPPDNWPGSARRVYCYFYGPLPATVGEQVDQAARPNQQITWLGH